MSLNNLPAHWKLVSFGDVTTFTRKPSELRYSEYNEIPFVPMELIPVSKLFSEVFTLKPSNKLTSGTYFEPGDILLSKITPSFENGKQCIIEELPTPFGIATTEVIPIREVEGVSDKFYLFYFLLLSDVRSLLAGRMQGTTGRQRLNKEALVNLEIPLPPLPEQRAIAHILHTIHEAKFTRQREIVLERERKAALMDFLFSHGTKGEPRKQTEIGEIPESWEVVKLGNYCYKPDYGYTESANDSPVGPKFLRITDIQNDVVNWQKVPYCICSQETKEKYLLKTGDIVIARIGATTGKAYIIDDCPEAIFASYLIRVRTKDDLLPVFLAQYFRSNNYWRQIDKSKGGRLKGGVNIPILGHLILPLPPLSEQREIANIFRAIDDKTAALEREVELIDELFHAMLEELMTGQRSAVPLISIRETE